MNRDFEVHSALQASPVDNIRLIDQGAFFERFKGAPGELIFLLPPDVDPSTPELQLLKSGAYPLGRAMVVARREIMRRGLTEADVALALTPTTDKLLQTLTREKHVTDLLDRFDLTRLAAAYNPMLSAMDYSQPIQSDVATSIQGQVDTSVPPAFARGMHCGRFFLIQFIPVQQDNYFPDSFTREMNGVRFGRDLQNLSQRAISSTEAAALLAIRMGVEATRLAYAIAKGTAGVALEVAGNVTTALTDLHDNQPIQAPSAGRQDETSRWIDINNFWFYPPDPVALFIRSGAEFISQRGTQILEERILLPLNRAGGLVTQLMATDCEALTLLDKRMANAVYQALNTHSDEAVGYIQRVSDNLRTLGGVITIPEALFIRQTYDLLYQLLVRQTHAIEASLKGALALSPSSSR